MTTHRGFVARFVVNDDGPHVELGGDIDVAATDVVRRVLHQAVAYSPEVVIDASGVDFIDSSGVNALFGAVVAARELNGDVVVRRPSARVMEVLGMFGLDAFLTIDP